ANRGLQHLLRSESAGDLAAIEVVEALKSRPALSLPSF
ncbi:HK97 family phage prohead protease, partial [Pseudomonas sp. GW456-11-11-14-TSB2]